MKRFHIKPWGKAIYILEMDLIKRATMRLQDKPVSDWLTFGNPIVKRSVLIGRWEKVVEKELLLAKAFRIINALERGEKYESLEHDSDAEQPQLILLDGEEI